MSDKIIHNIKTVWIPASQLKIHPIAQRRISPKRLKELIDKFNWNSLGTFAAVQYPRHGREEPLVVDGQHRTLAIPARANMDNSPELKERPVKMDIHLEVRDDAGACQLFLDLNSGRLPRCFDMFGQKVHAKDPEAVGISKLCSRLGLKIAETKANGNIACVIQLGDAWQLDAGKSLRRALSTSLDTFGKVADAVDGKMVWALSAFYHRYGAQAEEVSFRRNLYKYPGGPGKLLANARGFAGPGNSSIRRCVLQHIVDVYNQHRHSGRLERP